MSQWVRIVSWHLTVQATDPNGRIGTLCGRWADAKAERADDRPAGKTCESCLRIQVGR